MPVRSPPQRFHARTWNVRSAASWKMERDEGTRTFHPGTRGMRRRWLVGLILESQMRRFCRWFSNRRQLVDVAVAHMVDLPLASLRFSSILRDLELYCTRKKERERERERETDRQTDRQTDRETQISQVEARIASEAVMRAKNILELDLDRKNRFR